MQGQGTGTQEKGTDRVVVFPLVVLLSKEKQGLCGVFRGPGSGWVGDGGDGTSVVEEAVWEESRH